MKMHNRCFIDVHGHIGTETPFPLFDASPEGILSSMDNLGVAWLGISAFLVLSAECERGNELCHTVIERFPDRFFGYVTVDPARPRTLLAELEKGLSSGFRGIKLHSYDSLPYDHPDYRILYAAADAKRLPILLHTELDELPCLEKIIPDYPNIRFILAHAGCLAPEYHAKLAKEFSNVYLETSVSQCSRGLIEYFMEQGLADRMLWGTDIPLIAAEHQLGRVLYAAIRDAEKEKILFRNAAELFGLSI